ECAVELERLNVDRLYRDVELPLVDVLVEMEEAGIAVDTGYLRNLGDEFAREVARIEQEAYAAVGHEFPLNSPKQLQSLLFEELKLPRGRRTGTGFSTDATVLEELRGAHPVIEKILEYREIEKLRSTYAEGLGGLVDPETRRVHTTFEQTVAATGRLSSRAPNLQNIPIRTPLGRRIRRAFVAGSSDRVLVAADYSQIELRVLAHVSHDPALLAALRSGAAIHRRTHAAADIMKIAMARVHRALHDSDLHARVLLQVHDELVAEVPRLEVERMARLLGDEMSGAYELDVPLVVDVRTGPNWDEMQRLEVNATANA